MTFSRLEIPSMPPFSFYTIAGRDARAFLARSIFFARRRRARSPLQMGGCRRGSRRRGGGGEAPPSPRRRFSLLILASLAMLLLAPPRPAAAAAGSYGKQRDLELRAILANDFDVTYTNDRPKDCEWADLRPAQGVCLVLEQDPWTVDLDYPKCRQAAAAAPHAFRKQNLFFSFLCRAHHCRPWNPTACKYTPLLERDAELGLCQWWKCFSVRIIAFFRKTNISH